MEQVLQLRDDLKNMLKENLLSAEELRSQYKSFADEYMHKPRSFSPQRIMNFIQSSFESWDKLVLFWKLNLKLKTREFQLEKEDLESRLSDKTALGNMAEGLKLDNHIRETFALTTEFDQLKIVVLDLQSQLNIMNEQLIKQNEQSIKQNEQL
ncbi:unnamed protein product [Blepharisma stoltei]|uniref:Uncharacterized protein n=1 Tax=Blepharisma stoltei TaxID=1481888 RepID=A0AAU9IZF1_9CILI|nr:unnamed protein product [Blepharisma stoltei]